MTIDDETPLMTSQDDWVDLRAGDPITVVGRASTTTSRHDTSIMVDLPDWSTMLIALPATAGQEIVAGTRVRIRAIRTEDGLEAAAGDIEIREGTTTS